MQSGGTFIYLKRAVLSGHNIFDGKPGFTLHHQSTKSCVSLFSGATTMILLLSRRGVARLPNSKGA